MLTFSKKTNINYEGGGIALPNVGVGDEHGTKRVRSSQEEDGAPQVEAKQKQGRSRNRTRRHPKKGDQQDGANALADETTNNTEPHALVSSDLDTTAQQQPQEVVEEDDVDLEDDVEEAEDEDIAEGEDGEDKPRGPTAAMKKKMERQAQAIRKEAGNVILTLEQHQLSPAPSKVTWENEDFKLLCSYNWQGANDGTNTIFVPGGPARYVGTSKTLPQTIETDSGFQARMQS